MWEIGGTKFREDDMELLLSIQKKPTGIAYVYLIRMALNNGLRVSEFLLYFTAVTTFTEWVMGVLQEMSALQKESLDISLIREFLDYPEPFRFETGENIPKAESYELKLEHVSYRYPGADADTIHDLSLTVHPGEKLAIVGLNGAGKTEGISGRLTAESIMRCSAPSFRSSPCWM